MKKIGEKMKKKVEKWKQKFKVKKKKQKRKENLKIQKNKFYKISILIQKWKWNLKNESKIKK